MVINIYDNFHKHPKFTLFRNNNRKINGELFLCEKPQSFIIFFNLYDEHYGRIMNLYEERFV